MTCGADFWHTNGHFDHAGHTCKLTKDHDGPHRSEPCASGSDFMWSDAARSGSGPLSHTLGGFTITDTTAVDHPKHYNKHPSGIECVVVAEHMGFNIGNAMKYLWRAGLKDGSPTEEDYRKAIWYINREIAKITKEKEKAQ